MSDAGHHSRPFSLAKFDGRTRHGKFFREVRNELAERIGDPSPAEWRQIDQAARLRLFLEIHDAKIAEGGALTAVEARSYATFSAALDRVLRDLAVAPCPA